LTIPPKPAKALRMLKSAARKAVSARPVESLIHTIRDQQVMLDADIAELYGVTTKALNQAVKRNPERFPADFMFRLTKKEYAQMRSQFVTASKRNLQYQSVAFTQEGVAMLSAVLHSERAVQMSLVIMRAFVRLREILAHHKDLAARIEKLEHKQDRTVSVIEVLAEDIEALAHEVKQLKTNPEPARRRIGFRFPGDKD
jgi:hypothetical protein